MNDKKPMNPEQHRNAITHAMQRCCRAYGTSDSDGAIAGFEVALNDLVKLHEACLAHNEMMAALLQMKQELRGWNGLLPHPDEACPKCGHVHTIPVATINSDAVDQRCALCGTLVSTEKHHRGNT